MKLREFTDVEKRRIDAHHGEREAWRYAADLAQHDLDRAAKSLIWVLEEALRQPEDPDSVRLGKAITLLISAVGSHD